MGFVEGLYIWLAVRKPFDPQARFVTSYILSPIGLAFWRALISLYTFITIILVYVFGGTAEFSFFTVLSYWGVWAYFTVSAIHTFSFAISYRRWEKSMKNQKEVSLTQENVTPSTKIEKPQSLLTSKFPRLLQFFHTLLVSTICTYPLLVTIIFWTILSGNSFSSTRSTWENLSVHSFNLVFTMIEIIFLSRIQMRPWSHLFFCILLLAMYVGVAYITYADQGFYSYDFLDQSEHGSGIVAGFVIAIGVGMVISFMISQFLIFLREYIWSKIQKSGNWGSAKAAFIDDDALFLTSYGPGPEGEGGVRTDSDDVRAQTNGWRQRWPKEIDENVEK